MTATQALETIALRCCWVGSGAKNGRACVQDALLVSNQNHACHGENNGENEDVFFATSTGAVNYSGDDGGAFKADTCDFSALSAAIGSIFPDVNGDDVGTATTDSQERETLVVPARDGQCAEGMTKKSLRRGHAEWEGEDTDIGATSFALKVADSYSRDDSRTIVRRAGAARVAASALNLLRALLTDCGQRGQVGGDVEKGVQRDTETEDDEDEAALACCVQQFCDEQVFCWQTKRVTCSAIEAMYAFTDIDHALVFSIVETGTEIGLNSLLWRRRWCQSSSISGIKKRRFCFEEKQIDLFFMTGGCT